MACKCNLLYPLLVLTVLCAVCAFYTKVSQPAHRSTPRIRKDVIRRTTMPSSSHTMPTSRFASVADHDDIGHMYPTATTGKDNFCESVSLVPLTRSEQQLLANGERIQKQMRMGREGHGWVVLDLPVHPDDALNELRDFRKYRENIPTVRGVDIVTSTDTRTLVDYTLSKFRLRVGVVQTVNIKDRLIQFHLDKARSNPVLKVAEGFWYVQELPSKSGNPEDTKSRIWFSANVVASRLLPGPIVDYAADRALRRATKWLETHFTQESVKKQFDRKRQDLERLKLMLQIDDSSEAPVSAVDSTVSDITVSSIGAMDASVGNSKAEEFAVRERENLELER